MLGLEGEGRNFILFFFLNRDDPSEINRYALFLKTTTFNGKKIKKGKEKVI